MFDDVTHIWEAAVDDLICVFVKNVSVAMVLREIFLRKLLKSFPNISFNTTQNGGWTHVVGRCRVRFLFCAGGWYVRELGCSLAASASS